MSVLSSAPADVRRQVRRIEGRTRRLVDSRFAGEYRSLFKGQGMEFAEVREYQLGELATQRELSGSRRLRSLGLAREESERFFELVGAVVSPTERLGWVDLTEEVSPAGLQYGLLAHGRDRDVFASQLADDAHISISGVDPRWSDEQLRAWSQRFDVLLFSEPHHLRGRAGREFFDGYVERLESAGWQRAPIGTLEIARPLKEPLP